MTPREAGFLLLTSHLGDPRRPVLSLTRLRHVADAVMAAGGTDLDREMTEQDLLDMGLEQPLAQRILALLDDRAALEQYMQKAASVGIYPITRVSPAYPLILRKRLQMDAPGCLWAKGDVSILSKPAVALVGNRELFPENEHFARSVGKQAALQGFVLISGDARGADSLAQESCLAHGGSVICVVPDKLSRYPVRQQVLYLSEDGFDLSFTSQRALGRNRIIHALGRMTFVAQCRSCHGGTWSGAQHNLNHRISPLFCCADGSNGTDQLVAMGAQAITTESLSQMQTLYERL